MTPKQFGTLLRQRRAALRYSLTRLARESALAVITIRRLEGGEIERPYRHTLESLATVLYEAENGRRWFIEEGLRLDPSGETSAMGGEAPIPQMIHTQIVAPPIARIPLLTPPMGTQHLMISAVFRLSDYHGVLYRYEAILPLYHDLLYWGDKAPAARVECTLWVDGTEQCQMNYGPYDQSKIGHFQVAGLDAELIVERLPTRHVAMRQRLLVGGATIFDL
jgi:transcriptional regulator with XRE-family HTH domain